MDNSDRTCPVHPVQLRQCRPDMSDFPTILDVSDPIYPISPQEYRMNATLFVRFLLDRWWQIGYVRPNLSDSLSLEQSILDELDQLCPVACHPGNQFGVKRPYLSEMPSVCNPTIWTNIVRILAWGCPVPHYTCIIPRPQVPTSDICHVCHMTFVTLNWTMRINFVRILACLGASRPSRPTVL